MGSFAFIAYCHYQSSNQKEQQCLREIGQNDQSFCDDLGSYPGNFRFGDVVLRNEKPVP
jgi:hypothetical protein